MNRYGMRAKEHWQKYLPKRYQALENPEEFFENLGEEIGERFDELYEAYRQPLGTDYLKNVGNLGWARFEAERQALLELALLPAEDEAEESPASTGL